MRFKNIFVFSLLFIVGLSQPAFAWKPFGGGFKEQVSAADIDTDTTNFNGALSSLDDTIQDALDTLDNLTSSSGPFILKTGATTTTGAIPFAEGLSVLSSAKLTFYDSVGASEVFTLSHDNISASPTELTLESVAGTTPNFVLSNVALYATATDRMNVFGTSFSVSGITPSDTADTLVAYKSQTSTSGTIRGFQSLALFSGSSNSSGQNFGLNAIAVHTGSGNLTRSTTAGGLAANRNRVIIDSGGTGVVTLAVGVSSHLTMTSGVGGNATEFDGFQAELPSVSSNTLSTYAGVRVRGSAIALAGLSTAYGLKIDQFVVGSTNYEIALDSDGGIFFRTPTEAGTANIRSSSASHLDYNANTHHDFNIAGAEELNIQANVLTFNNGANDTSLGWATNDQLSITASALTTTGTFTSSATGSLGWSVVDQTDNQACTTGCTSACVFGIANATGTAVTNLVSCADTTADLCVCAGSS